MTMPQEESKPNYKFTTRLLDFNDVLKNTEILKKLGSLTLEGPSGMKKEIQNFLNISKKRRVNAHAIIAKLEDEIVAWALVSQEESTFTFWSGLKYNPGYGVLFEVFVSPKYRRMGLGSRLLKRARNVANGRQVCVVPWDAQSHDFFDAHERMRLKKI